MKCAGCSRELVVGDRYIKDTSSGFINADLDPDVDGIVASIFGGIDGNVIFCEDCTELGGDYMLETVYDEAEVDV